MLVQIRSDKARMNSRRTNQLRGESSIDLACREESSELRLRVAHIFAQFRKTHLAIDGLLAGKVWREERIIAYEAVLRIIPSKAK